MIGIWGVELKRLGLGEDRLREEIPMAWYTAWESAHGGLKRPSARLASLAGLWLLARSGAEGELTYTASGKPMLSSGAISITHTKGYVFCAVSGGHEAIGLDAEEADGRLLEERRAAMAARWFSEAERKAAMESEAAFYRIWTCKEAYVKMTGEGLCRVSGLDTTLVGCRFTSYWKEECIITLAHTDGDEAPREIIFL